MLWRNTFSLSRIIRSVKYSRVHDLRFALREPAQAIITKTVFISATEYCAHAAFSVAGAAVRLEPAGIKESDK